MRYIRIYRDFAVRVRVCRWRSRLESHLANSNFSLAIVFLFSGHPQYVFHHTPNPMEVLGKLDLPGDPKPTCHVGIGWVVWLQQWPSRVGQSFRCREKLLVEGAHQISSWELTCWMLSSNRPPCWIRWQHMITYDNTMCHRNMAKLRAWDKPFLLVKTWECFC